MVLGDFYEIENFVSKELICNALCICDIPQD